MKAKDKHVVYRTEQHDGSIGVRQRQECEIDFTTDRRILRVLVLVEVATAPNSHFMQLQGAALTCICTPDVSRKKELHATPSLYATT